MAKHHRLEIIYQAIKGVCSRATIGSDVDADLLQISLRQFEEFVQPEEARRTKRIEGNKYDERGLLNDLRAKFTYDEIWSEQEACQELNRPTQIFHLLKKVVAHGWVKKGRPVDFERFDELRASQNRPDRKGCRTFYQLIPPIHEVVEVSRGILR